MPPRHAVLLRRRVGSRCPPQTQGFAWLETLWATIAERAATRPAGSYTASLLDGGVDAAARKVTEEATEVLIAAKDDATAQASRGSTRPRPAPRSPTRPQTLSTTPSWCSPSVTFAPSEVIAALRARSR